MSQMTSSGNGCEMRLDEVDLALLAHVVDDLGADRLDRVEHALQLPRGERAGDDAALAGVAGVVHVDERAEELERLGRHVGDRRSTPWPEQKSCGPAADLDHLGVAGDRVERRRSRRSSGCRRSAGVNGPCLAQLGEVRHAVVERALPEAGIDERRRRGGPHGSPWVICDDTPKPSDRRSRVSTVDGPAASPSRKVSTPARNTSSLVRDASSTPIASRSTSRTRPPCGRARPHSPSRRTPSRGRSRSSARQAGTATSGGKPMASRSRRPDSTPWAAFGPPSGAARSAGTTPGWASSTRRSSAARATTRSRGSRSSAG